MNYDATKTYDPVNKQIHIREREELNGKITRTILRTPFMDHGP
jgi:hypothetical protein